MTIRYKRGDIRADGKVFDSYDVEGYERWVDRSVLLKRKRDMKKSRDIKRATKEGHALHIVQSRRSMARKKGIEFSISELQLIQNLPEICPIMGIKLSWGVRKGTKGSKDNSPSLDKIDPSKGYVPGNVMWISYLANRMKSNATPNQLKTFANWVLANA